MIIKCIFNLILRSQKNLWEDFESQKVKIAVKISLQNVLYWMYLRLPKTIVMGRSFWDSFKATIESFWKILRQYEERVELNLHSMNIVRTFKFRNILEYLWLSRGFLKVENCDIWIPGFSILYMVLHTFYILRRHHNFHLKLSKKTPFLEQIVSSPTNFRLWIFCKRSVILCITFDNIRNKTT